MDHYAIAPGLVPAAALLTGAAQLWLIGAGRLGAFAAGWAFNVCALLALWLACELFARASRRPRWAKRLFYPLLFVACGAIFAHALFFDVAVERRLSFFDLTAAGLREFFALVLPVRGLLALLGLQGALLAAAFVCARFSTRRSGRAFLLAGACLALGTGLVLRAERVASPLFDTALEAWQLASLPKLTASAAPARAELVRWLDKSARVEPDSPARHAKVIVLVMETMTAERFARERAALSEATFLKREQAHFLSFERYFPNNQDSRTGMLAMLFSRLIPFEAYSEQGFTGYRQLARERSLVDRMRALSYASAFAVSATTLEDVVGELSWDRTLRLSEPQIEAARAEGKLCFTPDPYERSCEDRALLPAVLAFLQNNPRAFVYQEFIWGHAAEYNEASGLSNAAYYSAYLDALLAGLSARGLLGETLIALTSDHGFRDRGRQNELEVYRIPLLFYAPERGVERDGRLLSHSDFAALLFEQLSSSAPHADDNPFVMIVGPTGQGHLFVAGRAGGQLLMRRKLGLDLAVSQTGALPFAPELLLGAFELYRARFAR